MLGFSIGVVGTGLVYGTVVHDRVAHDGTRGHGARGRDVLAQAQARVPLELSIAPPLPLFPRYGDPVAPGTTLAWHLLDGTDGAQVEILVDADLRAGHDAAAGGRWRDREAAGSDRRGDVVLAAAWSSGGHHWRQNNVDVDGRRRRARE